MRIVEKVFKNSNIFIGKFENFILKFITPHAVFLHMPMLLVRKWDFFIIWYNFTGQIGNLILLCLILRSFAFSFDN